MLVTVLNIGVLTISHKGTVVSIIIIDRLALLPTFVWASYADERQQFAPKWAGGCALSASSIVLVYSPLNPIKGGSLSFSGVAVNIHRTHFVLLMQ